MKIIHWLTSISYCFVALSSNASDPAPTPSLNYAEGGQLYVERCLLCHGSNGMGEGVLPLKIPQYPDTNLLEPQNPGYEEVFSAIKLGKSKSNSYMLMPPMEGELTDKEIESVSKFVLYMRENNKEASKLIKELASKSDPNRRTGEQLYATRCVLCHGKDAKGTGRMAKMIKDPPPANLLNDKLDVNYIKKIVELGGEKMGRSPAMPPWGDQFSENEIESIALYILHLRDTQTDSK